MGTLEPVLGLDEPDAAGADRAHHVFQPTPSRGRTASTVSPFRPTCSHAHLGARSHGGRPRGRVSDQVRLPHRAPLNATAACARPVRRPVGGGDVTDEVVASAMRSRHHSQVGHPISVSVVSTTTSRSRPPSTAQANQRVGILLSVLGEDDPPLWFHHVISARAHSRLFRESQQE